MYEQHHQRKIGYTRLLSKHIVHSLQNYTLKLMHSETYKAVKTSQSFCINSDMNTHLRFGTNQKTIQTSIWCSPSFSTRQFCSYKGSKLNLWNSYSRTSPWIFTNPAFAVKYVPVIRTKYTKYSTRFYIQVCAKNNPFLN